MAYIYLITNDVNQKVYIGKTEFSIEKRFKEHCQDAFREKCELRPLYNAMRKYGIKHFSIKLIEETCEPEIREQYWIQYYNSYKNGYNATLGGDGKKYINYDQVISLYNERQNISEVANILNIHRDSVHNILKANKINIKSSSEINKEKISKITYMFSLDGEYLRTFSSMMDAARYLIENDLTKCKLTTIRYHISEVCAGKRKTAAGFKWSLEK